MPAGKLMLFCGGLVDPYLPKHNVKYAVEPREQADFHQALAARLDLNQVFCLEHERKVGNDWVVQYDNRWLQIEAQQKTRVSAGNTVTIRQHRDGSLTLLWQDMILKWHELAERPSKPATIPKRRVVRRPKPGPEHPWRQPIVALQQRCRKVRIKAKPFHEGKAEVRCRLKGCAPPVGRR